jgi:hypothetical protein
MPPTVNDKGDLAMPRFPIASRDTVPQDQVDTFGVIAIRLMRDMLSRATLVYPVSTSTGNGLKEE